MKRKLAIVLNMLAPYWLDVFNGLGGLGWDVRVFRCMVNEPDRQYEFGQINQHTFKVETIRNTTFHFQNFNSKTRFLHVPWGLLQSLVRFRPDVIISNELGPRTILAQWYGRMFSVPVIPWVCASIHTERHNSLLREKVRKYLLKNSPCVCTNLTEGEQYLVKKLCVPKEKIFHTPYVIDVGDMNESVKQERILSSHFRKSLGLNGIVFLYVGQMIKRKGLEEFARSVAGLPERFLKQLSCLFVGGQLSDSAKTTLDKKQIMYRNIGFVQRQDLPKYYALADAFVFPTLEDEWGIVLNEAAAAGLPIMSSVYAAATTDLVEHTVNGFRFDPLDETDLQQAIVGFLQASVEARAEMSAVSLRLVRKIDVDFTLQHLNSALRFALGNGSPT